MDMHKITLGVGNGLDILVECTCGWVENLGFEALPVDAINAQIKHTNELMIEYLAAQTKE